MTIKLIGGGGGGGAVIDHKVDSWTTDAEQYTNDL